MSVVSSRKFFPSGIIAQSSPMGTDLDAAGLISAMSFLRSARSLPRPAGLFLGGFGVMVSAAESCRFFASLQHKMPLGRESGKKLARVRKVYKRVGWLILRWMVQYF